MYVVHESGNRLPVIMIGSALRCQRHTAPTFRNPLLQLRAGCAGEAVTR